MHRGSRAEGIDRFDPAQQRRAHRIPLPFFSTVQAGRGITSDLEGLLQLCVYGNVVLKASAKEVVEKRLPQHAAAYLGCEWQAALNGEEARAF